MRNAVTTDKAPRPIGPYSQAIIDGDLLFLAGQGPIDPATGATNLGDIASQTRRTLDNVKAILEAAGSSLDKVIRCNVYLKDIGDFAAMNEVYARTFTAPVSGAHDHPGRRAAGRDRGRDRVHRAPMTRRALAVLVVACLAAGASAPGEPKATAKVGRVMLYVGTYTSGDSKGIYRLHLDPATGALSPAGDPTETVNPSFLAFHPSRRFLYAVNETGDAPKDPSGAVSAFAIDPATGALTFLNQQPSGGAGALPPDDRQGGPARPRRQLLGRHRGGAPDPGGRAPRAADARVVRHQGRRPSPGRPAEPHPHSINLDAANRFAFVADLGLDKVVAYGFDGKKGLLAPSRGGHASVWRRGRGRVISPSIPTGGRRT